MLPLWAVFAIGFGSPLLAFLGVLVSQLLARKGSSELESRSRREETLRTLRWAAELGVSDDESRSRLGVQELKALLDSDLLTAEEKVFVDAALAAVVTEVAQEVAASGEGVEIVMRGPAGFSGGGRLMADGSPGVTSKREEPGEEH